MRYFCATAAHFFHKIMQTTEASGSALKSPLRARVTQTITEAPHGNALAACAASILGLSIDDTPNFVKEPDYLAAMQTHAACHGCSLRKVTLEDGRLPTSEALAAGSLCIARGTSPRGHGHVVVASIAIDGCSLEFVHDPFPSGGFLDGQAVWAIIYSTSSSNGPPIVRPFDNETPYPSPLPGMMPCG